MAWVAQLERSVRARNARETHPFRGIMGAYAALRMEYERLVEMNGDLSNQLRAAVTGSAGRSSAASFAIGDLRAPSTSSPNAGLGHKRGIEVFGAGDNGGDGAGAEVSELRKKLVSLQEELNEHYKTQANDATEKLNLQMENNALKATATELQTHVNTLTEDVRNAQSALAEMQERMQSLEEDKSNLQAELANVRRMLTTAEEAKNTAESQRHELEMRIVEEKNKAARVMDQMNAMMDAETRFQRIEKQGQQRQQQAPVPGAASRGGEAEAGMGPQAEATTGGQEAKGGAGEESGEPDSATRRKGSFLGTLLGLGRGASKTQDDDRKGGGEGGGGDGQGGAEEDPSSVDAWGVADSSPPTVATHILKCHETEINDVCYNETGSVFVTASADSTVRVWDAATGRSRFTLRSSQRERVIPMIAVDVFENKVIGTANDGSCRVWNAPTERLETELTGHQNKLCACKFAQRGTQAVTGGYGRSVKVWDIASRGGGRCVHTMTSKSYVFTLDITGDSQTCVSGHKDGSLRFWDLRSALKIRELTTLHTQGVGITSASFSRDELYVLTMGRDNVLNIVDVRTDQVTQRLEHDGFRVVSNWSRATFSPGGSMVAAPAAGGEVVVWDAQSGDVRGVLAERHERGVIACHWSTRNQIVSCDQDGCVVAWA